MQDEQATFEWHQQQTQPARSFVCGHCGIDQSSDKGYFGDRFYIKNNTKNSAGRVYIYICHRCRRPSFFDDYDREGDLAETAEQSPTPIYGEGVKNISDDVIAKLYNEARRSVLSSPTAAVLACRKILMHVAVSKGAKAGLNFKQYVKYFTDKNFVPPDSKDWVDHIREKGNEANHEIVLMTTKEAETLLDFTTMLLKVIYEYPSKAKSLKIKQEAVST